MLLVLAIAQYEREGFPAGEEHWALVTASSTTSQGQVFQVVGNTDTYGYNTKTVVIRASHHLCGGVAIGEVPTQNVEWLKTYLSTAVTIVHGNPNWHCQRWVIEAIRKLQEETSMVTIYPNFSERAVRARLSKERDSWEDGDDHFFDTFVPAPPAKRRA